MSTGKRIAKRSILGTRVVAPGADGRFYPAVITSVTTRDRLPYKSDENKYTVCFDNSRRLAEFSETALIGPGFGCVSRVAGRLLAGQRVYLTHLGREVEATVGHHDDRADIVSVLLQTGEELTARPDELRLLESRKSSRLMVRQTSNQDFSKLGGELGGVVEERRKTERRRLNSEISSNSDSSEVFSSRKRRGSESVSEEGSGSSSEETAARRLRPASPVMSECTAAMVLMDLSGSPGSRCSHLSGQSDASSGQMSPSSSGVSSLGSSWASPSLTPPFPLPHSPTTANYPVSPTIPSETTVTALLELSGERGAGHDDTDEGIVSDHSYEQENTNTKKTETRTIYQCTWPACLQQETECHLIERHVRVAHLGREGPVDPEDDDREEEFYYTEFELPESSTIELSSTEDLPDDYLVVEEGEIVSGISSSNGGGGGTSASIALSSGGGITANTSTAAAATAVIVSDGGRNLMSSGLSDRSGNLVTPAPMMVAAPPPPSTPRVTPPHQHQHHHQQHHSVTPLLADHCDMARPPHENPEYSAQRTGSQVMTGSGPTYATIISPTSSLGLPTSTSLGLPIAIPITTFTIAGGSVPGKYIRLSPKPCLSTSPKSPVRRPRGDAKKCRKVYGMDQRDLWCTQCKWKKACTRFGETGAPT